LGSLRKRKKHVFFNEDNIKLIINPLDPFYVSAAENSYAGERSSKTGLPLSHKKNITIYNKKIIISNLVNVLTRFYFYLAINLINNCEFSWKTRTCLGDPKLLSGGGSHEAVTTDNPEK